MYLNFSDHGTGVVGISVPWSLKFNLLRCGLKFSNVEISINNNSVYKQHLKLGDTW